MSQRAVFLDRDGVLNANVYYADSGEWEAPRRDGDLALKPGVIAALQDLGRRGYRLFLVSNQPSCAKGKTSMENLKAVHHRLEGLLGAAGIELAEALYCYHHPQGSLPELAIACRCRKPSTFMVTEAASRHGIDLAASWLVGDRDTDIECGRSAGTRTIQVASDHPTDKAGRAAPHFHAADLKEAAAIIRDADRGAA